MWFFRREVGIAGELPLAPKTGALDNILLAFCGQFTTLFTDNFEAKV